MSVESAAIEVIAAVLVAVAAIVGALGKFVAKKIGELTARNDEQHASNLAVLRSIERSVHGHTGTLLEIKEDLGGVKAWQSEHEKRHERERGT